MKTSPLIHHTNDGQSIHDAVSAAIRRLHQDGLLTCVLPGYESGFDRKNMAPILSILKATGRTDLSLGRLYEGHVNALLLIYLYASEEQKQRWYNDARNGHLFGVWNTEGADGVSWHLQDGDRFCAEGKKTFASGAGIVSRALVTGRITENGKSGWQMCIIEADRLSENSIDYDSWHPMGMQSSLSYTVSFSGYCGSRQDMLGSPDVYYNQPFFGGGAIRFFAVQLGGAEALFNETVSYLKSLNRTDDAIQMMRLGEMAMEITSGNNWLLQAANHWNEWIDDEQKKDTLTAYINLARTAIERICLRIIELNAKCVGARGLMKPYAMESISRDLQFYLRQPAPDAVLNAAAKYVVQSDQTIENMWNGDIAKA